MLDEEKLPLS